MKSSADVFRFPYVGKIPQYVINSISVYMVSGVGNIQ